MSFASKIAASAMFSEGWSTTRVLFAGSIAAGIAIAFAAANPRALVLAVAAITVAALLAYPEFALALYVIVGDVKGDDRVAALLPFDWTIALGVILAAGLILNWIRGRRIAPMPPVYFLLGLFTVCMAASLSYAPSFEGGIAKFGRFVTVTGIVVIAPFFVLGTEAAMKRFFAAFGAASFAICGYSLLGLGGDGRLVSPSDNTIGLGHVACALLLLLWFAAIPRRRWPLRLAWYVLFAVPAIALVGSGSRGSAIACAVAILLSLYCCRRRIADLLAISTLGFLAIPFLRIPAASFDYLSTLLTSGSVNALLDFRSDLLGHGWQLVQRHPLIGAGIAGFQYSSPNPAVYKWPHNIFLEVACELGLPALILILVFFGTAIRESVRQLRSDATVCGSTAQLAAAWLLLGIVNALNTGDINSDRTTWLFASIVFVVGSNSCGRTARPRNDEAANAGRLSAATA